MKISHIKEKKRDEVVKEMEVVIDDESNVSEGRVNEDVEMVDMCKTIILF